MTETTLIFDPVQHTYRLGSRQLPSVTQVLKDVGLIDATWFTDEARLRGTYVHMATQYLDEGDLAEETVDPRYLGYLNAYRRFLETARPVWERVEARVHDALLGYAGTFDRLGTLNGTSQRWLIDIKTGDYATAGLQTAAYRRCLEEPHMVRRAALQLSADGSFNFHELSDRRDEPRFLAALTVWQTKQEIAA